METPEDAVAKLSIDEMLQLRSTVHIGADLRHMPEEELTDLYAKWIGPKPPAPLIPGDRLCKAYVHRQRIALELHFRSYKHRQQLLTQQVGRLERDFHAAAVAAHSKGPGRLGTETYSVSNQEARTCAAFVTE